MLTDKNNKHNLSMSNTYIETGGPIEQKSKYDPWNALVIKYALKRENFKNASLKMRLNESACIEVEKGNEYKLKDLIEVKCPKGVDAVSHNTDVGCSNKCDCVTCKVLSAGSVSMIANKTNLILSVILLHVFCYLKIV